MKKYLHRIVDWEHWPFKLLYAPISLVWVWYIIRSGSVWFFTPSNPKLTFGGMEGEPKKEMYDLLPPELYPATINVLPSDQLQSVSGKINAAGIGFPLIVKPEVGAQGILLRKINNIHELENYHLKNPVEYIIQALVSYPMEVSIFYYRYPGQAKGVISGFLHKIPLMVVGNGVDSLESLIRIHPKASKRIRELKQSHHSNFNRILSNGEKYILNYAANHNRGAQFIDLKNHIDDQLIGLIDKISLELNDFFYGRYDILCSSIVELKKGNHYSILEYNGCGAEPNHFYDTGYTLIGAYKEILKHWKVLFEISRENHKKGIQYWSFLKGLLFLRETKRYFRKIRNADKFI